ncbi:MAG: hypothetical protein JNK32_00865 [Anaerolineales bacterium]|nr:hypothetical protein [Anaerolineales bacterium]
MTDAIQVGDHVQIYLGEKFGEHEGWYTGTVFQVEPYSEHRSFYWIRLDEAAQTILKIQEISVFNPKNIQKLV